MEAILYVGHGSRVQEGNEQLRNFVTQCKKRFPNIPIQHTCFIELEQPSILEGIKNCVDQGATVIAVMPILLLTAGHAKEDIPKEISKARELYPSIKFKYGRPFGVEKLIVDVLKQRLIATGLKEEAIDGKSKENERQSVAVLLIGRGSSDPDANSDLFKIARLLWEYTPIQHVECAYLAATTPTVDQGLERLLKEPVDQVILLPYLLFTGILMKSLEQKRKEKQMLTSKELLLSKYLGFDDQLIEILKERVEEVLYGERDE
ncbi:hypothetical protein BTS2_3220 [Bacillus sp. TS-2]|nr:hypothetical protein BTS2_3220 [Bacillus sp. TS-2]